MKWSQIWNRILFSFKKKKLRQSYHDSWEQSLGKGRTKINITSSIDAYSAYENNVFVFLNLSHQFKGEINWNFREYGKLWTYNLNYFEFLNQPHFSKEKGILLINDFIQKIHLSQDGLEPFPTSLRLVNWIKFLVHYDVRDEQIERSVYAQLLHLEKNLEYHLLGNHLLENYFSLIIGAVFFDDESLYARVITQLEDQLEEQIHEDGGHFELSPMYHQLMLFRALDTYNFLLNGKFNPSQKIKNKIEKMLGWLAQMTFENGAIPLLNDSANCIAPSTSDLFAYAKRLGLEKANIKLSDSGYRKMTSNRLETVVDIGCLGADYILAHAHSDTFNFVLQIENQPFLVDTGISTYEANGRRSTERSTISHNTVQIGSNEQSEIWSSFRVARRVKPNIKVDKPNELEAQLKYSTVNEQHRRSFRLIGDELFIKDVVLSNTSSQAFFHFFKDVDVKIVDNCVHSSIGSLNFEGFDTLSIEPYFQATEFNKLEKGQKLVVSFKKELFTSISPVG